MTAPDARVARLRIRGGTASRRLAAVAHTHLPGALDGALAGLGAGPARLERLRVVLDLDPADYDDVTLAALWADRIRAAALAALPGGWRPPVGEPAATGPVPVPVLAADATGSEPAARAAGYGRALRAASPGESRDALARQLLQGADARLVAAVLEALPPAVRAEVVLALAAVGVDGVDTGPTGGTADAATGPVPASPAGSATGGRTAGARSSTSDSPSGAGTPELPLRAAPVLSSAGVSVPVSAVGGLVLLYPWLPAFCAGGERLLPDLDPVAVRITALAALAGADPGDPLVRLLAGDPRWTEPPARTAEPGPEAAVAVAVLAAPVLSAFAGMLPGFGRSTPDFVRDQWVRRAAVLLPDAAGTVRVRLARRPLDLVLDRLPYPLGALRLAWTPPLGVGWEAA